MTDKVLSMIGMATRAGKIVSGEFAVEKAIKSQKAFLVIVATDSSDNSKKNYSDACHYYETELCYYGTKETLGNAIGKEYRASVAILDENFAEAIKKKLADVEKLNNGGF